MSVYLRVINSVSKQFKPVYCAGIRAAGLKISCTQRTKEDQYHPDSVVSYEQLKTLLTSHSIQLFDVRNQDEFLAGCIPDAVNIPLGQLEESLKLHPDNFEKLFKVKAPKKEDDNIVFHCQKGRRSLTALDIAWNLGFSRARHYAGGYKEWAEKEKQ
ncbi:thiosulfate:glutathione sulfurtransferase [Trichomycterus rosablanca]|uniref:thiosulfate:glutathione sulfurtransferase n=1 Tax=Trichomycterus rosablanca TaxID=2290929 RepID=UPI002F35A024